LGPKTLYGSRVSFYHLGMRISLLALIFALSPAHAGDWTRVDKQTIKLDGPIKAGEYDRFLKVWDGSVKELLLNSSGGVTEEGLKIGHVLAQANVKVVVIGVCLSSCANYLFVGGHEREIRGGLVGFHGNVKACFGSPAQRAETIREMKVKYKMTDAEIKRELAEQDAEIASEERFLQIMGVDQALFDRSCTADKGRKDGKSYTFLLPKPATFDQYRLFNVKGAQDLGLLAKMPWTGAHD
jgi:hypothetical protein